MGSGYENEVTGDEKWALHRRGDRIWEVERRMK
jgi:hypothetical protein